MNVFFKDDFCEEKFFLLNSKELIENRRSFLNDWLEDLPLVFTNKSGPSQDSGRSSLNNILFKN